MDDFVPEENWPETRMMIEKVLAGESFSSIISDRFSKDGVKIPVSISGSFYRDQEGNISATVVNLRDITLQKQAEEQRDRFVLKLQDTLAQVEVLSAISQTANQSLNLDQILNDALDKVMELFKPHFAHIRLFDDQTQEMVLATYKGHTPEDLKKLTKRKKIENTVTYHAIKAGAAVVIKDPLTDPRVANIDSFGKKIGCRSMIALVLYAKNKILGNMDIYFHEPHDFTDDEVRLFTSIGHQVGTAIENAKLYQQTQHTVTELKRAQEERERLITDLQKALAEVKTLSGLLPICSQCKNVRDDKGYWSKIEAYIHKHSGTEFSHIICPECSKKYYPDMDIYDDNGEVTEG